MIYIKTFLAKKSFRNAKKVFKKFLQGFASFDPPDVEGAAFHSCGCENLGGSHRVKSFSYFAFSKKNCPKKLFQM
jgi:hypothetical protein